MLRDMIRVKPARPELSFLSAIAKLNLELVDSSIRMWS